jgi:hypothetical protein
MLKSARFPPLVRMDDHSPSHRPDGCSRNAASLRTVADEALSASRLVLIYTNDTPKNSAL